MNAMIFAAGLGTRLRPLTNDRPKALVEVAGKPLLQHQIEKLKAAGFEHIVVNVHHFGEQIINFLAANNQFGLDIKISDEREMLLDTGGGIKAAMHLFDNEDPVLIHNVDIISDIDLGALYRKHLEAQHGSDDDAIATLAINQRKTSRYLLFDEKQQMCGWTNISTGEVKPATLYNNKYSSLEEMGFQKYAFSGIHVVDHRILSFLEEREDAVFPIMDFYIDLCQKKTVQGVDVTGQKWVDCGKPEHLDVAKQIICSL